jgi:pimeloyl-ACP methyl ester carboxylesterase
MDQQDSVRSVRAPTLIVAGQYDAATPPSSSHWLAEQIPGACHVELPAAHLSNIEAETAFNEAVLGFLADRESKDG